MLSRFCFVPVLLYAIATACHAAAASSSGQEHKLCAAFAPPSDLCETEGFKGQTIRSYAVDVTKNGQNGKVHVVSSHPSSGVVMAVYSHDVVKGKVKNQGISYKMPTPTMMKEAAEQRQKQYDLHMLANNLQHQQAPSSQQEPKDREATRGSRGRGRRRRGGVGQEAQEQAATTASSNNVAGNGARSIKPPPTLNRLTLGQGAALPVPALTW